MIDSDVQYVVWDTNNAMEITVFYQHSRCKIAILAVYVDDINITDDDEV